jgi:hypothetical protein
LLNRAVAKKSIAVAFSFLRAHGGVRKIKAFTFLHVIVSFCAWLGWKLEARNWKLEVAYWLQVADRLETGNWGLETGDWRLGRLVAGFMQSLHSP